MVKNCDRKCSLFNLTEFKLLSKNFICKEVAKTYQHSVNLQGIVPKRTGKRVLFCFYQEYLKTRYLVCFTSHL